MPPLDLKGKLPAKPGAASTASTATAGATTTNVNKNKNKFYFKASMATFNFNWGTGPGQRSRFTHYWFVTDDARIVNYIREHLMPKNGDISVEELHADDYEEHTKLKDIVQPVIVNIPDQSGASDSFTRDVALHARAPRTADQPGVMEKETGSGMDHLTTLEHTDTQSMRPQQQGQTIQEQRNAAELAATGGAKPAVDTKANPPLSDATGATTGQRIGMANSTTGAVPHPNAGNKS